MLKTRVMPTLLFKDNGLVKGVRFASDRRVGAALQSLKVYNLREVDELVFLDVSATHDGRPPDFAQVDELADECFMPMTVGGGVSRVDHIQRLLAVGADKVAINSAGFEKPELISEGARMFGRQCIVASIDVRREGSGWQVYSHCGTRPTGLEPVAWAAEVESLGAGEILLTSVDRDGTMNGYDVEITRRVSQAVSIPVIASGGAGEFSHMAEVLKDGHASAVAAASIFHFTQKTPLEAKAYLKAQGFAVRI
jgi:cyclase